MVITNPNCITLSGDGLGRIRYLYLREKRIYVWNRGSIDILIWQSFSFRSSTEGLLDF